jgi:DNA invertase Pin-like site-specific DNA recombinase
MIRIMKKKIRVVQLIRTSTPDQNPKRQKEELDLLCKERNWIVVEVLEEVGSGSKNNKDRISIDRILFLARNKKIDKVVVQELSRLGRKTGQSISLCEQLSELGVSVYEKSRNIETLNDDGTPNAISSMLLSVLASLHSMESSERNSRIRSGMKSAIAAGIHCGRYPGSDENPKDFLNKYKPIVKSFENGENLSLRKRAILYEVSVNTVRKIENTLINNLKNN